MNKAKASGRLLVHLCTTHVAVIVADTTRSSILLPNTIHSPIGLAVSCRLHRKNMTARKLTDEEMKTALVKRRRFHADWNYVISAIRGPFSCINLFLYSAKRSCFFIC